MILKTNFDEDYFDLSLVQKIIIKIWKIAFPTIFVEELKIPKTKWEHLQQKLIIPNYSQILYNNNIYSYNSTIECYYINFNILIHQF